MSEYAIGDVQGCYEPLMRLLQSINFDETVDRLWFVGDLVNRGPDSLRVLRFIKNLRIPPVITLGNHDLHLLSQLFTSAGYAHKDDTLHEIVTAKDALELGHWLRMQPLLHYDKTAQIVMTHAGIPPIWHLEQAIGYAHEVEQVLRGDDYQTYLQCLYGNESIFSPELYNEQQRLRVITNYFTRMRFCNEQGHLDLRAKGVPNAPPDGCFPWYLCPARLPVMPLIIFGHWAAIGGGFIKPDMVALDSGCVWGGNLTALRLHDRQLFSVKGFVRSLS